MTTMLSDTEKVVVETIRMRLTTEQALQYLKYNGFSVSRATYFRHKRIIEETKLERLYHIAKIGFVHQHLERIDDIELALKEMWANYLLEKDIFKKVLILEKIIMVQPYLSSYYEATAYVIDNRSANIQNLIRQEEEKKEINKKVFDKYNHDKNNFIV